MVISIVILFLAILREVLIFREILLWMFGHCTPQLLTRVYDVVGRGGALVESIAFNQRVVGSNPAPAATLGKSFTRSCLWRFGMKLRHSIRAVSGTLLSRSGLEEAL